MNGHEVLNYLFDIVCENQNVSVFAISTFTFATTIGILLCSNIDSDIDLERTEKIAIKHDLGSIASELNKLQKEVQKFTLRLDMQNAEQEEVRKIVGKIENKQYRLEESLYSSGSE